MSLARTACASTLVVAEPWHLSHYAAAHSPHAMQPTLPVQTKSNERVTSPHAPQHAKCWSMHALHTSTWPSKPTPPRDMPAPPRRRSTHTDRRQLTHYRTSLSWAISPHPPHMAMPAHLSSSSPHLRYIETPSGLASRMAVHEPHGEGRRVHQGECEQGCSESWWRPALEESRWTFCWLIKQQGRGGGGHIFCILMAAVTAIGVQHSVPSTRLDCLHSYTCANATTGRISIIE
jgi:hypothetical protein